MIELKHVKLEQVIKLSVYGESLVAKIINIVPKADLSEKKNIEESKAETDVSEELDQKLTLNEDSTPEQQPESNPLDTMVINAGF